MITLASLTLVACAAPQNEIVEALPAAEGTAVPLGKGVEVGPITAEALDIVEDSRCPVDVQCVWAGRLVVRTSLAAYGWSEVRDMALGEPVGVRGTAIVLTSATPDRLSEIAIDENEYRFVYRQR